MTLPNLPPRLKLIKITSQQIPQHKRANTSPTAGGSKNYIDNSNGTNAGSKLPLDQSKLSFGPQSDSDTNLL